MYDMHSAYVIILETRESNPATHFKVYKFIEINLLITTFGKPFLKDQIKINIDAFGIVYTNSFYGRMFS